jgi:hypothetical protein
LSHLEEKNGKKVDKEYIIKKILFDLFNALVLSDINSGTRDYILELDSSIMNKLEAKVTKFLFSFDGGDFLKEDIKQVSQDKTKVLEDEIILSAKKFA